MISKSQCVKLLLKEFPEFKREYEENKALYTYGKRILLTVIMGAFASFARREFIEKNKTNKLKKASDFIEKLIVKGNKDVSYAAKFGFIEGITNDPSHIERLTKYFGIKSKEFCKDLDKFWGTKTKGI